MVAVVVEEEEAVDVVQVVLEGREKVALRYQAMTRKRDRERRPLTSDPSYSTPTTYDGVQ